MRLVLASALAVLGACTDFADTPDPLLGTWTRVSSRDVLDVLDRITYHPDHRFDIAYPSGNVRGGSWRRLGAETLERCFDNVPGCTSHDAVLDGDMMLDGEPLLGGPAAPGFSGTWSGSGECSCCANGSQFCDSTRLDLMFDGVAFYSHLASVAGPPGQQWSGTWTETVRGIEVQRGDTTGIEDFVRVGSHVSQRGYRRTVAP